MSEMIERVAKVLAERRDCIRPFPCEFCDAPPSDGERGSIGCRALAHAAISALRELPPDLLETAFRRAPTVGEDAFGTDDRQREAVAEWWRAIIDQALAG